MASIDPGVMSALAAPFMQAEDPDTVAVGPVPPPLPQEMPVQEYSAPQYEAMPGTSTAVAPVPKASTTPEGLSQGPRRGGAAATATGPATASPGGQPGVDVALSPQQIQELLQMMNLGKNAEADLKAGLEALAKPSEAVRNLVREQSGMAETQGQAIERSLATVRATELAYAKREQTLADEHRKQRQRFQAEIDDTHQQMMNHEIDPRRMFKNSWQALGAAMASAMGAFAQAYHPGKIPNTAMLLIDRAIQRDIDAQKTEFRKMGMVAGMQQNVYSRLLQTHGDERRAELQTGVLAIKLLQNTIEGQKVRFKSERQRLAADIVGAQLESKSKELGNLEQVRQSGATMRMAMKMGLYGPGALARVTGGDAAAIDSLSNKDKEVLGFWGSVSGGATMLAGAEEDLGWWGTGPLSWGKRNLSPFWNSVKAYDLTVKGMLTNIVYAMSGKTVTKIELEETWKPQFPKASQFPKNRRETMLIMLKNLSGRSSSWLGLLTPAQQGLFERTNKEWFDILGEKDAAARHQLVEDWYLGNPVFSGTIEGGGGKSAVLQPDQIRALNELNSANKQGGQPR